MRRKIALLALTAALALAGCSGGGKADHPPIEPTVSTPVDETATPAPMSADFATAVKFTKLVHEEKYREASELVVPESPAARYVAHQTLVNKAIRVSTGYPPSDDSRKISVKPDPTTNSINIVDKDDERKVTYTWKDFTFDQGKLTGWTGKSGAVKDVLWTRTTSDTSHGRKAKLQSAYLANSGALHVVVELSSSQGTSWGDAEYTGRGGYRQAAAEQYAGDIGAGEKTLGYFVFEDAKFGGTMHLSYYDDTLSGEGDYDLALKIK
jgi:hypothetical protein